jgi:protein-S-isoprenylcysteine O-methyltransferase Ste14
MSTAASADADSRRSKTLGRFRLVALWVVGAALVALGLWGRPDPLGWGIGLIVAGLGVAVRSWAAGYLIKSRELITGGPYAYVRNPLYLGRVLIGSGICIAVRLPQDWPLPRWPWPNLIALAVFCAFFFGYYMPRKERVEPARLEEYHGESYRRYREAVPSLLPNFFRRYDRRNGAWGWPQYHRLKEYNWVLGYVAIFTLLGLRAFDVLHW